MKEQDKQLLLKDLCSRLPYGVKFALSGNSIYTIKGIDLIVTDEGDWEYAVTAKGINPIEIKYIKPYLRPMSSMTKEEKEEYMIARQKDIAEAYIHVTPQNAIDWLNKNHFDYRGLIGKELALEAKEGMYKTE